MPAIGTAVYYYPEASMVGMYGPGPFCAWILGSRPGDTGDQYTVGVWFDNGERANFYDVNKTTTAEPGCWSDAPASSTSTRAARRVAP